MLICLCIEGSSKNNLIIKNSKLCKIESLQYKFINEKYFIFISLITYLLCKTFMKKEIYFHVSEFKNILTCIFIFKNFLLTPLNKKTVHTSMY